MGSASMPPSIEPKDQYESGVRNPPDRLRASDRVNFTRPLGPALRFQCLTDVRPGGRGGAGDRILGMLPGLDPFFALPCRCSLTEPLEIRPVVRILLQGGSQV